MRFLMAVAIGSMLATGAAAGPLDGLRWQKRVVLVFEQNDAERAAAQHRELAGNAGLGERDLAVIEVPKSGTVAIEGIGELEAAALRRAYAIAEDAPFTVLLVGKDGGVKQRSAEPLSAHDLFATIDAMPMRANEMRRG